MTTVTIDILNDKALNLLKDLEALDVIKVHNYEQHTGFVNFAEKYKGKMSKQTIEEIESQLKELRDEWE